MIMDTIIDYRKSKRLAHKATVMIEFHDTGAFHYATTQNFSADGIYCGSDYAIKPGTFITLRIDTGTKSRLTSGTIPMQNSVTAFARIVPKIYIRNLLD